MSDRFAWTVAAISLAAFAVFFAWPVFQILRGGFVDADGRFTVRYLVALLADRSSVTALANSLGLAAATTVAATALALPLARVVSRYEFPGKPALGALILAPMILPPFVGAIGVKQLFGQYGAFNAVLHRLHVLAPDTTIDWLAANRFWGVVLVQALSLYPIVYLNLSAALANLDPAMEEAAQNLGSTGFRRFRRITLPLIRPGLFAGATLVFIWSFTELGTPLIFDYNRVASVQIYEGLKDIGSNPVPFALVSLVLFLSVTLYAGGRWLVGRGAEAPSGRAARAADTRPLPPLRRWACTALLVSVAALALLPHLGVVVVAFARDWFDSVLPRDWTLANFQVALSHPLTLRSIANSLRFAAIATAIDVFLGVAIAYVIVRSSLRVRHLLDVLTMLPLAVPGLVLAFGYLTMSQDGRLLGFLNATRDPTLLIVAAYAIRRLPYVVRSSVAGLEQTSVTYEEAAQNLGATPLRAMRRVTLPLIMANVIAGGVLAFAFAMLEVSDSLVLAQKQAYYPITKTILELFQLLGDGRHLASALGVWAMVFLGLVVGWLSLLLGRRMGMLFRV